MSIAIIGFGKFGQEILLKGLQNNIFSPEQKLEYHVFGDGDAFGKLYHSLDEIDDPVNFYDDWMDHVSVLGDADLIIAADPGNEMELVRNLVFAVPEKKIHVVSELPEVMGLFDLKDRLAIFDWKNETLKPELMFEDRLMATAKKINLKYAHLYSGVAETAENAEKEWKTLNSFTKYSNVSSADYHEIRMMMLKDWNIPASGEGISAEQLEMLSELEHIRWSRYHYLSNWTYGVPENGKAKDSEKRIHTCLVPYDELPEEEKKKDRDNILVMLGVEV